jgi:apolipoprotein N-acyltransferase
MIDPRGRVVDALAMDVRGVVDVIVPIRGREASKSGWVAKLDPHLNGLAILVLFAAFAGVGRLRQRAGEN